jgi:ribosomal protein S18 acetylase RimI-like enzyme
MPESIEIRLLTKEDGADYQQLRLESLQTNPDAFLSSYEAEEQLDESTFANHLEWAYHPPTFGYFGIFVGGKLAGYVQASKSFLDKEKHICSLNNVYISKEFRKQGLATKLLNYVTDLLKREAGIERVFLSCTGKNKPAHNLYRKLNFRRYAVRAKAIKWEDQYDDTVEMVKVL